MDDSDRDLLAFLAEHRLVLETHAAALLEITPDAATERLQALDADGCIAYGKLFADHPAVAQIRARGLAAVGSSLRPPQVKLAEYRHDVGLAWLWLAARRGRFGELADIVSERRMRSHDGTREPGHEPYAVRLGGRDGHAAPRVHYPDLLLIDGRGRRLGLELELSPKTVSRRERILGGYGADARFDAVLYLVEEHAGGRGIARGIQGSAQRMDLTDRIFVQFVHPIMPLEPQPARSARALSRSPGRPGHSYGRRVQAPVMGR